MIKMKIIIFEEKEYKNNPKKIVEKEFKNKNWKFKKSKQSKLEAFVPFFQLGTDLFDLIIYFSFAKAYPLMTSFNGCFFDVSKHAYLTSKLKTRLSSPLLLKLPNPNPQTIQTVQTAQTTHTLKPSKPPNPPNPPKTPNPRPKPTNPIRYLI